MIESPLFPYAFALVIAIPFLLCIRRYAYGMLSLKQREIALMAAKGKPENRFAALERMTIFLERLKPANLVNRFDASLKPHEFLFLTEKSIREEFDYNAAQQLYISQRSWQSIVAVKNNIIHQLQKTYENSSGDISLEDFKTIFLMNYINGSDEISEAIQELKKEMTLTT